jgi:hypothetical protein
MIEALHKVTETTQKRLKYRLKVQKVSDTCVITIPKEKTDIVPI